MLDDDGSQLAERMSWDSLVQDHERILGQCERLSLLTQSGSHRSHEASNALLILAVTLADHLGIEDEMVDRTAAALSCGYAECDVVAMHDELDALRRAWTEFLLAWTPRDLSGEWADFAAAVATMMPRLVAQVHRETEILYGPAFGFGLINRGRARVH